MTPQSLENLPEALFLSIIECLRHGLKSDFGQEVTMILYFSFFNTEKLHISNDRYFNANSKRVL